VPLTAIHLNVERLVYPGADAYPVADGVQAIGLRELTLAIQRLHFSEAVICTK